MTGATAARRPDRERGRPARVRDRGGMEGLIELPALRPIVEGKRCLVIGSAPLESEMHVETGDCLIVVNGAISTFTHWAPNIWILNARKNPELGWSNTRRFLNATMQQQGAGRHVGALVTLPIGLPGDSEATLERLQRQGTTWNLWVECSRAVRERVTFDAGAFRDRDSSRLGTSAGLFGVCLAAWLGARAIELHGFSFTAGYAYLPADQVPVNSRGHVRGDKAAIANLVTRGVKMTGDTVTRRRGERVS